MEKTQKTDFVLDDALRHLYIALRKYGASLVAIRFIHRGKKWEADTPEEAVKLRMELELADILEGTNPHLEAERIRAETVWTPDTFWNFVNSVGPAQQKAIVAMLRHDDGIEATELVKLSGLPNAALGGILSGLSKQLKQVTLKPSDLYLVHTDWSDNKRMRIFFIQKAFRLAAEEAGWPEERKLRDAATTKQKARK